MTSKKLLEINTFVARRSSFSPLFPRSLLIKNICGLAQSLVVVNEKVTTRTTWKWQEQVSCNRRTIIILHIRKKIISVLFWQDHCVIVCCTTHACACPHSRRGLIFFSLFSLIILRQNFRMSVSVLLKCSKTSIFQETSN